MKKIYKDKYYTPIDIANLCWDLTMDVIGEDKISEIIEPSCGNGSFYHHKKYSPHFGYDIEPECNFHNIICGDYLIQDINYLEGRLVIGNPPYGEKLYMTQKFFRKSTEISDYIAFILPIGQLNNTNSMYEFDLVHSEDLGYNMYSGKNLHCCFNIYKRPTCGELNKRNKVSLKDISIYRQDSIGYNERDFDIRICYWGNGSCGKILKNDENYAAEYKIKINNMCMYDEIYNFITTFDWKSYVNCIAMKKIQQFHIINVLKSNIINIT